MKTILAFSIFLLTTIWLTAQVSIPVGTQQQVNAFMSGKTYVVLENAMMSDYNDIVKASIEKNWTITPVEYITLKDFESKRKEKNVSFLMINQIYFDADKTQTLFDFFVLIAGGNYKSVNDMPLLCMVPLCYNEADEETWVYKIPVAIRFTQMHMKTVKANTGLTSKSVIDFYMGKKEDLEGKTLYVLKKDLEPALRNTSTLKSIYPYSFKFIEEQELSEIMAGAQENTLILHVIAPAKNTQIDKCIKMIIDPQTAQLYYYDMHNIGKNKPIGLLESDIKKILK